MSLVKPRRAKGEPTVMWISRRDSYRLEQMEQAIEQLRKDVKKLQVCKK